MDWYLLLLFLHIMSLVFWLGTDLGVFVLGKFAQNPEYDVKTRLLLLKVAMILDMFPRVFMVVTIPTGYQMAVNSGSLLPPAYLTILVWVFSVVWLAVVIIGLAKQNTALAAKVKKIEKLLLFILLAGLAMAVAEYFMSATIIQHLWLAGKLLMYAAIISFMFLLERSFGSAITGFLQLEAEGSSLDTETLITNGMDKTYFWVIAIYGAVMVSAILGIWKVT